MIGNYYYGTGRRKTSSARVSLRPGGGDIRVNGKPFDDYFPNEMLKMIIRHPLVMTETADKFDLHVRVAGGGYAGQAGALRHGIARALISSTAAAAFFRSSASFACALSSTDFSRSSYATSDHQP